MAGGLLEEVAREPSLSGAELDELEASGRSRERPHLDGLTGHQDAERAVHAARGDVVASVAAAEPAGVVARPGVIERQLHEARERHRAGAADLVEDGREQAR